MVSRKLSDFNPRAHEGHDGVFVCVLLILSISIHVPTRGTTYDPNWVPPTDNFNPRAHEGHDGFGLSLVENTRNFNPRAHEGHDDGVGAGGAGDRISIHVPTRGTTRHFRRRMG